jgi:hypothetical protein
MAIVQAPKGSLSRTGWPGVPAHIWTFARCVCTEQGELPLKASVYQEGAVQNKGSGAGKSRKIKILQEACKAMDCLKKAPGRL